MYTQSFVHVMKRHIHAHANFTHGKSRGAQRGKRIVSSAPWKCRESWGNHKVGVIRFGRLFQGKAQVNHKLFDSDLDSAT
jgi:hypothetical protein